jgi:hypothetical protein
VNVVVVAATTRARPSCAISPDNHPKSDAHSLADFVIMAFRRPQQPKHHDHQQEGWDMLTTPPARRGCLSKPDN